MTIEFVRVDVIENVHGRLIERYGGRPGLRDANGLASAAARPQQLMTYGDVQSLGALGAALAWALLRNHPFADGNKRVALAAMVLFLELNGYQMICPEVEETAMTLRAAASEISEEMWTEWVERSVGPVGG